MGKKLLIFLLILLLSAGDVFAEVDLDGAISYSSRDDGAVAAFKIDFLEQYGFLNRHRVNLIILRPGASFSDSEDPDSVVYAMSGGRPVIDSSGTVEVSVSAGYGYYPVRITLSDPVDDSVYIWEKVHNFLDPNKVDEIKDIFNGSLTAAEFAQKVIEYAGGTYIALPDGILNTQAALEELFPYFEKIKAGCALGAMTANFKQFTSAGQITDALEAAKALRLIAVGNSGAAAALRKSAPKIWDKVFPADTNFEKFNTLYDYIDKGINAMLTDMRTAIAFSYIMGGSYADVEKALSTFPEVFGINLAALSSAGVDLLVLARTVNTSISGSTNLTSASAAIAESAARLIANASNKPTQVLPGGGGGGGTGNFIFSDEQQANMPSFDLSEAGDGAEVNAVFIDIDDYAWARDDILALYARGVIAGVGDRLYEPERRVTREEFVKLLVVSLGLATDDQKPLPFFDCVIGEWYYPYVEVGYAKDVVEGIGDGLFGIGEAVTRQDAAVIISRALTAKTGTVFAAGTESTYTDADAISEYAHLAVNEMTDRGFMAGYPDGAFGPLSGMTRAEAAVIMARIYYFLEGGNTQ